MNDVKTEQCYLQSSDLKKYVAEFIGTMVLVLMGCGSAVIAGNYVGYLGISFAFGLAVLAMAYTIGSNFWMPH